MFLRFHQNLRLDVLINYVLLKIKSVDPDEIQLILDGYSRLFHSIYRV